MENQALQDQLCEWDNLWAAYAQAAKGKRGKSEVAQFEFNLGDELLQLQAELREQRYAPGAHHSFYIHEPKRRLISAAPFRDRVVHHALCNVTVPQLEARFIADSFANRVGKGTHRALDRFQQFARRFKYVLQCDVEQFFPAIDHDLLRHSLQRMVPCLGSVQWLVDAILRQGQAVLTEEYAMRYFADDDLFAINRPRGLPIGNLTSQWWANSYLNAFDHFAKRELGCRGYVRYVDDFALFADDKRTLWRWRESILARLAQLRLTIHEGQATPRPVGDGSPFLGFIIYPAHRRLKPRKGHTFVRKLRRMLAGAEESPATTEETVVASVQGWINHVRYGDTWGLRQKTLREFNLLHDDPT